MACRIEKPFPLDTTIFLRSGHREMLKGISPVNGDPSYEYLR